MVKSSAPCLRAIPTSPRPALTGQYCFTIIGESLANPVVFETVESDDGSRVELLFLGPDETGRVLEVVAIREEERLVVIHAMDMRSKYRLRYEGGISSE